MRVGRRVTIVTKTGLFARVSRNYITDELKDRERTMKKSIKHSKLECVRKSECPDCDAKNSMLMGPRGGASVNVKCENCGSRFNVTPFGVERI